MRHHLPSATLARRLLLAGLCALAASAAQAEAPPAPAPGAPAEGAAEALAGTLEASCIPCHEQLQPGLVSDWRLSRHAGAEVGCEGCHGTAHATAADPAKARHPTVQTCQRCHELQAAQFRDGDHARAWNSPRVLPTFHHLEEGKAGDPTGCATCHRIGLVTPELAEAHQRAGSSYGLGSCDACHTRHTFAASEARAPEACKSCHGDLQYEAWAASKHGVRHAAIRLGQLPPSATAPTCQTCHLQNGNHAVRTPLGNVALRLPLESDQAWAADKQALFQALGVLDRAGGLGPRGPAFEEARIAELDRVGPMLDRSQITQACRQCHATAFVQEQLDLRDQMIRQADALVAGAVREVAALYAEGLLQGKGPGPHPDLVKWPTGNALERRLGLMFFDHRAKLLAHAFHLSPLAVRWQSTLQEDAQAVHQLALEVRAAKKVKR